MPAWYAIMRLPNLFLLFAKPAGLPSLAGFAFHLNYLNFTFSRPSLQDKNRTFPDT